MDCIDIDSFRIIKFLMKIKNYWLFRFNTKNDRSCVVYSDLSLILYIKYLNIQYFVSIN